MVPLPTDPSTQVHASPIIPVLSYRRRRRSQVHTSMQRGERSAPWTSIPRIMAAHSSLMASTTSMTTSSSSATYRRMPGSAAKLGSSCIRTFLLQSRSNAFCLFFLQVVLRILRSAAYPLLLHRIWMPIRRFDGSCALIPQLRWSIICGLEETCGACGMSIWWLVLRLSSIMGFRTMPIEWRRSESRCMERDLDGFI